MPTKNLDDLKIVYVPVSDLKPAEYNPRKHTKDQAEQLKESITRFGLVDPIICNSAPKRMNVVIGGHFILKKYGHRQRYGIFMNETDPNNLYADMWAKGYSKLVGWIQQGGRLIGQHKFDDLLYIIYTDLNGKRSIIDREELHDNGIDTSIPDALALTIAKEKRHIIRPPEDRYDDQYPDLDYNLPPQYPEIGI